MGTIGSQPLIDLGLTTGGQPVDMEAAQEFMRATLEKIEPIELKAIETELENKSRRLQALLSPQSIPTLSDDQLHAVLRSVFAMRRRSREILGAVGSSGLKSAFGDLLLDSGTVEARFQQFVQSMSACFDDVRELRPVKSTDSQAKRSAEAAALTENIFCDLGSELLHFTDPEKYWLWTRWIWDPEAGTGAMPLVTMEEVDLYGATVGETYLKLGVATAFVKATGQAADFSAIGDGPFGIDVFLVSVYAVYMYTTLRMRMTQEFNKVVPQLPELVRRLLGVWRMEL